MQLIDKQNDGAFRLADLFQNSFQALLKFSAVLGTSDQSTHIQREDGLLFKPFRHITADDTLGKPFGDRRFADARLADQNGIVLRLAREDTDHIPYLVVTPDHGIQFVFSCPFDQIRSVLAQSVVGIFRIVTGNRRRLYLAELCRKRVFGNAML